MTLKNAFENLAVESKQDAIITELQNLLAEDFATEATLAAVLAKLSELDTTFDGVDFATETTLSAAKSCLDDILAAVNAVDTNTDEIEAKLDTINTSINNITVTVELDDANIVGELQDIEADIETLITNFNAEDFATETTLSEAKTALESILTAVSDLDSNTDEIESKLDSIFTLISSTTTSPPVTNEDIVDALEDVKSSVDAFKTAFDARDLATETTLDALKTLVDNKLGSASPPLSDTVIGRLEAIRELLDTFIGQDSPPVSIGDVKNVLDNIYGAVDDLEVSVGDIEVNTDEVETKLDSIIDLLTAMSGDTSPPVTNEDVVTAIEAFNTDFDNRDLATEAKQDDIITELQEIQTATEAIETFEQVGIKDVKTDTETWVSHFGALKTSATYPVLKANFPNSSLEESMWEETSMSGATVVVEDGVGKLQSGTDAAGTTKIISVDAGAFEAGQVTVFQSGVYAGDPIANNIRRWGLMDYSEENGLFFELNGTAFRVVARKAGVDTAVDSASFNIDTAFTPTTTNNTYRIFYSAGRAIFCAAQSGNLRPLHTMVRGDLPLVDDLDLNVYFENTNTGNTTATEMRVRGASSSIFGQLPTIRPKNINRDINNLTVLNPVAAVNIGADLDGEYDPVPLSSTSHNDSTQTALTNSNLQTFTVDAGTDIFSATAHGYSDNDKIVVKSDDTLPAPLERDTVYYVVNANTNDFQLSESEGGSPIDIEDTGTGTHTAAVPGEFIGQVKSSRGLSSILAFAFGLTPLSRIRIHWYRNETTPRSGLLKYTDFTESEELSQGFYIYLNDPTTTMIDKYCRIEVVNGSDAQTTGFFETDIWAYSQGAYPFTMQKLNAQLSSLSTALLTRSVNAGIDPDGEFKNFRVSGRHSPSSTITPLAGNGVFRGEWLEWQGNFAGMITDLTSDQDGQFFIDFSEFADPVAYEAENGIDSAVQDSLQVRFEAATTPIARRITPVQSRWVRVRYINDSVAQTFFTLDTAFIVSPPPLVMQRMAENTNDNQLAALVKSGITAPDSAREWRIIERIANSLATYVTGFDPEVELDPNTQIETFKLNVVSNQPTQIPLPTKMSRVRGLEFTNTEPSTPEEGETSDSVFFRETDTNVLSDGNIILPNSTKEWHYGNKQAAPISSIKPVFLQAAGTSTSNELIIDSSSVVTSTDVTDPNNILGSDDSHAIMSLATSSITVGGFNASASISETNFPVVKFRIEGKKESSASTETIAFDSANAVDSGNVGSGTPITTQTIPVVAGGTYFIAIARRAIDAAVQNVTSTMGFSGWEIVAGSDISNGNESRVTVIKMNGTPTSSGTVSVTLTNSSDHHVIGYTVLTNVHSNYLFDIDNDSSGSGSSVSGTVNTLAGGMLFQVLGTEITEVNTLTSGFTERAEDGSTSNNDQVMNLATRPSPTATTLSWGASLTSSGDFAGVCLSLRPAEALDPIMLVSHGQGSKTQLFEVTNETDDFFEFDISNEQEWTAALLDDAEITIDMSVIGTPNLELDDVKLIIEEAGAQVTVTGMWIGDAL